VNGVFTSGGEEAKDGVEVGIESSKKRQVAKGIKCKKRGVEEQSAGDQRSAQVVLSRGRVIQSQENTRRAAVGASPTRRKARHRVQKRNEKAQIR
jgi:hypothetical protein